jgi:hypothetical protein
MNQVGHWRGGHRRAQSWYQYRCVEKKYSRKRVQRMGAPACSQIGSRLLSNQCRCALQAVSSGGWLSQTVCCTGIKHHGKRRRRKEWLPGACLKPQQALP